ncbi:MAG: peptidoglycan recognition family protein [Pseudoflavonifractor sp.]|nr:peptidoglycan recognition family protein [Pseudoflavonifractor sp.]
MTINWDYPCHPKNDQGKRVQPVAWLVIHYVGALGDAEQNAYYYGNTPGIGASAHYFVDHGPDAGIWGSVPESRVAGHCGRTDGRYKHPSCRNANSIGIEMCCHKRADGTWYFDAATVDRTVELARDIMARYGIDTDHVLRHYDVTGKVCPAPFVQDTAAWEVFKARLDEPGEEEMKIYNYVKDMPEWAQEAATKAIAAGIIKMDAAGAVNVYECNLQPLVWMDRAGLI